MASPVGHFYPVGLQHCRIYQLNEFGLPKAVNATVYEGLEIVGPKTFEMTPTKTRDVVATGNDRRLSQDKLPSLDVSSAVLKTSRLDFELLALLTGTKEEEVGEARIVGFATDQQGQEPAVGLLAYQKGKIAGTGTRAYGAYHMPSAIAIIDPASMGGNDAAEYSFNLVPSAVNHYLFGPLFTMNDEGYLEAELNWSLTFNLPHVAAWISDADDVDFLYHVARPAVSVAKIHSVVTVHPTTGVVTDVTATVTKTDLTKITFGTTPGTGVEVIAFYEHV